MMRIPCVLMRGGTSRGPFFLREHLPDDDAEMDKLLLAVMGSPHSLQVDGIGGGHPLTSKVAIISPACSTDADVDYLFAQVAVEERTVDRRPNCGNMLSAVGPFAIEAGLIAAHTPETRVRIRNLNTGTLIEAVIQTPKGEVIYEGDTVIDGVPGSAAPIRLSFMDAQGAATGKLLPTGSVCNAIENIGVTLIDGAMPMMLVDARSIGLTGSEMPVEIEARTAVMARLEDMRREAGLLMGLGDVSRSVIPKIGLLAPARKGGTVSVRYLTPTRCHTSIAVTGAVTVATSLTLKGSVGARLVADDTIFRLIRIEHPSGAVEIALDIATDPTTGEARIQRSHLLRTARRIFEGHVLVPSSALG